MLVLITILVITITEDEEIKKKLFMFVLHSFFITLINLGSLIRGSQTRYTVANFRHSQPLYIVLKPNLKHSFKAFSE